MPTEKPRWLRHLLRFGFLLAVLPAFWVTPRHPVAGIMLMVAGFVVYGQLVYRFWPRDPGAGPPFSLSRFLLGLLLVSAAYFALWYDRHAIQSWLARRPPLSHGFARLVQTGTLPLVIVCVFFAGVWYWSGRARRPFFAGLFLVGAAMFAFDYYWSAGVSQWLARQQPPGAALAWLIQTGAVPLLVLLAFCLCMWYRQPERHP
jgi:hypothetical protein